MRPFRKIILLTAAFSFLPHIALGQSIDDGIEAFQNGNYVAALENFEPLAEQGNPDALNNLAVMYQNGLGVPQNYSEALLLLDRAAEKGSADANYNLATMYYLGQVLPKDIDKAFDYLRSASIQGHAMAQSHLGTLYYSGEGVIKNPVLAYMLSILAAAKGYEDARNNSKIILRSLSHEQVSEGQRFASEWEVGTPLPTSSDVITWP